jgi:hypothetical protein
MQDFVIETLSPEEIQKHLRQWRHEYTIKIIHYSVVMSQQTEFEGVRLAHIVVERIKKQ